MFPGAPVVAVNGASREVKAFALVSQHPENFINARWVHYQRRLFGDGFTTHSTKPPADHVWEIGNRGGSAWLARRIAGLMGFAPVVLCGCPMTPGPYANGSNLGGYMHKQDVVDELFRQIAEDVDNHAGALSMSGLTRELLGSQ